MKVTIFQINNGSLSKTEKDIETFDKKDNILIARGWNKKVDSQGMTFVGHESLIYEMFYNAVHVGKKMWQAMILTPTENIPRKGFVTIEIYPENLIANKKVVRLFDLVKEMCENESYDEQLKYSNSFRVFVNFLSTKGSFDILTNEQKAHIQDYYSTIQYEVKCNKIKTYKRWQESNLPFSEYCNSPCEIDRECFWYFLEVVPPIFWTKGILQVGEASRIVDGRNTYPTFAAIGERYFFLGDYHLAQNVPENKIINELKKQLNNAKN